MRTLNPDEKHEMFQRASARNPKLTFDDFEKNLQEHRSRALKKANPNAQHFRTVNNVVVRYQSPDDMGNMLRESDVIDMD